MEPNILNVYLIKEEILLLTYVNFSRLVSIVNQNPGDSRLPAMSTTPTESAINSKKREGRLHAQNINLQLA